ncbi:hypothetical protein C8J57DRAFT_1234293 [Mycena rebaudengoi]|nr:hypothetical protein C8J57DRAFT_1234293 [Mycena rebaudengoi]
MSAQQRDSSDLSNSKDDLSDLSNSDDNMDVDPVDPGDEAPNWFLTMTPDTHHCKQWTDAFRSNKAWWPSLCSSWNEKLESAFFAPVNGPVKTQEIQWVKIVKASGLGRTICRISDVATLIDTTNPHSNDIFLKIRAQDSLCEVLDSWVQQAPSWERTKLTFVANPKPNAKPLDAQTLWNILNMHPNLVPRAKIPQTIQVFLSKIHFELALNTWLGPALQKLGYNLTKDKLSRQRKSTNATQERLHQEERQKYNLDQLGDKDFPPNACLECWQLPDEQCCRQNILVHEQNVQFLKGCGMTLAPEGQQMKPKPPPKARQHKKVTKMWTPSEFQQHGKGYTFEGIERDEQVIGRCGKQVLYFRDKLETLVLFYAKQSVIFANTLH